MRAIALFFVLSFARAAIAQETQTASAAADAGALACEPECRTGYVCLRGSCVDACNPPCGPKQQCIDDPTGLMCVSTEHPRAEKQPCPEGQVAKQPRDFVKFGSRGHVVLDGRAFVGHAARSQLGEEYTEVGVGVSLGYFLVQNFAIDGTLVLGYGTGSRADRTEAALGGGAHVNIPLTTSLSFYPGARLSLGYTRMGYKDLGFPTGSVSIDRDALSLILEAPLLFHLVEHVFIGAGPLLTTDLVVEGEGSNANRQTLIYLDVSIGVWL